MNRYFDASSCCYSDKHKVIVFSRSRSPGKSYWTRPRTSPVRWTLTEMKTCGHPEITRTAALKLIKGLP